MMTELEQIAIEWQCEKLGRQFANYSDQDNFSALVELFTEDGIYIRPSVPDVEIKGRETLYDAFLQRPPLVIKHIVSNCVIEVISATAAKGHSYIMYIAAPKTGEPLPLTAGPFHLGEFNDDYVLSADGWKIKRRQGLLLLKT